MLIVSKCRAKLISYFHFNVLCTVHSCCYIHTKSALVGVRMNISYFCIENQNVMRFLKFVYSVPSSALFTLNVKQYNVTLLKLFHQPAMQKHTD
jgi:hypothetical protein